MTGIISPGIFSPGTIPPGTISPGMISFQGLPGAYSDLACRGAYPDMTTLPCLSFEAAIDAVRDGQAALGMLPCENTLAGRVSDIHHLLPESGLFIVGEAFQRVEHCLLGVPGATVPDIRRAHSHSVALGQVRRILQDLHLTPVVEADTAGAAQLVAKWGRKEDAAIASSLAAEIYGLQILRANVEDATHNTTPILRRRTPAGDARSRDPGSDDHVRFPRPQRPGGVVQGARWVRHQRRQHDQTGKLHARGANSPPRNSCAMSMATLNSRDCAGRWRSFRSSQPRCVCSAFTRWRASGWHRDWEIDRNQPADRDGATGWIGELTAVGPVPGSEADGDRARARIWK